MDGRQLRTFRGLSSRDRAIVVEAVCLPLAIRVGFAVLGVPRTRQILSRWATSAAPLLREHSRVVTPVVRLQAIVNRKTRWGGTCLVRSLTLWAILQRRGVESELRIGVRKMNDVMEGHAWLELQGAPINETPETTSTYAVFDGAAQLCGWRD